MRITVAHYIGVLQFSSSKRNSCPENSRGRREKIGVFFTKTILAFPSGFIFSMIRPLHFKELDYLLMGSTFSLIKNADRMLLIREIILQFEHLMIHCTVWVLETASELRYVENIMNLRKVHW
jgi:hypothetical protein